MHLTILAASGATGRELTGQALDRGHTVTALVRDPSRVATRSDGRLVVKAADVRDAESILRVVGRDAVVLSGLGVAKGDKAGALAAGARAVADARPARIIWLGAYGTGESARAAGLATRTLLRLLGDELTDKVTADTTVIGAGGTVFHAGPLKNGPLSRGHRTVGLSDAPRRLFPARISRATVAAAMLDEAENARFAGRTAVPLGR